MGTPTYVSLFLAKGSNFCDFIFCFSVKQDLFKMGSTLKGKSLLLEVQILTFKS